MCVEGRIGDTGRIPKSLVTKNNDLSSKDNPFEIEPDYRPSYNSIVDRRGFEYQVDDTIVE